MMTLPNTLASWGTERCKQTFIDEVMTKSVDDLRLQQALAVGSHALKDDLKIMINQTFEEPDQVIVRAGIFYSSIIAGCNCADDPSPVETQPEYCELEFVIDRVTAETLVRPC